jgi:HemY protein
MRLLVFILVVLLIATILTLAAARDPGYVLMVWPPWSLEMPLTLYAVFAVTGFLGLYLAARLTIRALRLPKGISLWRARRFGARSRTALARGLTALAGGDWKTAESELQASVQHSEAPLISYLALAMASQGQGDTAKRDDYLAQAYDVAPENDLATGMTQAMLQVLANQREQALATLTELHSRAPEHRYVLKLLADTYLSLKDWTGLGYLLPELRKQKVMKESELSRLEVNVHRHLLMPSLPSGSLDVLRRAWQALPKNLRQQPGLVAVYAGKLIEQGEHEEAESLLRDSIGREWNEELVALYGDAHTEHVARQYDTARTWRTTHSESPALHLALGKLALASGSNGEAIQLLEQATSLGAGAGAYLALGKAYERTGDASAAQKSYRDGLESCLGGYSPPWANSKES